MKKLILLSLLLFMKVNTLTSHQQEKYFSNLVQELHKDYSKYKVTQIQTRRFEINDYHRILDSLLEEGKEIFNVKKIGSSFKGRDIKLIKFGEGKLKILMWSQMHGDESTASLALLDLINLLKKRKDLSDELKSKISLFIIPILNPDGANEFERRN